MLTAIFERFFTPINDSLLEHDLYAVMMEDELDITTEQIEAEQRLNSPDFLTKNIEDSEALAYQRLKDNHNYYKPKVNLTDVLKSLLKE